MDDFQADGNVAYQIVTVPATSSDPDYNGRNASDVAVTNLDNDAVGIQVQPTTGQTTEAGGTASFQIVLTSQPTSNVTIGLSSSDTSEGAVSPASIVFTPANWNSPQTVMVVGQDDMQADGNTAYTIVTAAAISGDPQYNGRVVADVSMTNLDNDAAGVVVQPTSGQTAEGGGTATFTISLTSQPTDSVTIDLASSDVSEGTISLGSVTFTTPNWNVPQVITATGQDDDVADGNVAYSIVTAAARSTDPAYNARGA